MRKWTASAGCVRSPFVHAQALAATGVCGHSRMHTAPAHATYVNAAASTAPVGMALFACMHVHACNNLEAALPSRPQAWKGWRSLI